MDYAHIDCPTAGKEVPFRVWIGSVPRCPECSEVVPPLYDLKMDGDKLREIYENLKNENK